MEPGTTQTRAILAFSFFSFFFEKRGEYRANGTFCSALSPIQKLFIPVESE